MNPALRILEDWTTHQDYFWFLAVLAWSGVVGAEFRLKDNSSGVAAKPWLIALAVAQIGGALVELALLAQDLQVPYTKFDLAMGATQAAGTMALVWGVTTNAPHGSLWRRLAIGAILALAAARVRWPLQAGIGLAGIQAAAVLGLFRQAPWPITRGAGRSPCITR